MSRKKQHPFLQYQRKLDESLDTTLLLTYKQMLQQIAINLSYIL